MLSLESANEFDFLKYHRIDSFNIATFRHQNSLLFPVSYPESFYRNILSSPETSAYLVFKDNSCIGSVSTRIESSIRWNGIRTGKTIDNFNPVLGIDASDQNICYIMTLGVLASHRYLGYGAKILEKVIYDAINKGIKCIGLHVHIENRNALKFYDRWGFKVIGKVEDYYKKITPNSAFILELILD